MSDIFQNTYMELFLILQKKDWTEIQNEEAFLIKIAKNKIYRYYTLLEKVKNFFHGNVEDEPNQKIEETDLSLSPEEKVIEQCMVEQAHRYLKGKDELTRKIFYLYYYEDVTISQISSLLSVKESTVKNRLYRTLKELRFYFVSKGDKLND